MTASLHAVVKRWVKTKKITSLHPTNHRRNKKAASRQSSAAPNNKAAESASNNTSQGRSRSRQDTTLRANKRVCCSGPSRYLGHQPTHPPTHPCRSFFKRNLYLQLLTTSVVTVNYHTILGFIPGSVSFFFRLCLLVVSTD